VQNTFEGEHDLCHFLVKALQMREKYMAMSLQNFCQISSRALHKYDMDFNPVTKFEPEYPGYQFIACATPYIGLVMKNYARTTTISICSIQAIL
jgi:hypothetical protein